MNTEMIIIRRATDGDERAVRRLAALDDRRPPGPDAVLAFVNGELAAARELGGARAVADPFRHTSHLMGMLEMQAHGLRSAA